MSNYSPRLSTTEIKYLALEGGGGKGNAFLGALESLAHPRLNVVRNSGYRLTNILGVAGASAGAITSLFLAAGFTPAELKAITDLEDFNQFFDAPNPGRVFRIGGFEDHPRTDAVTQALVAVVEEALALYRDLDVRRMAAYISGHLHSRDILRHLRTLETLLHSIPTSVSDMEALLTQIRDVLGALSRDSVDSTLEAVQAINTLFNAVPTAFLNHVMQLGLRCHELIRRGVLETYLTALFMQLNTLVSVIRGFNNDAMIEAVLNRDLHATAQALVQDFGILTGEEIYNFFRRWLAVARLRVNHASEYQTHLAAAGGDIPACFARLKRMLNARADTTLNQYFDEKMTFEAFEREFQIKFAVTGSNLENLKSHVFSGATTPGFYVVDAVRLSMALPYGLFFKPLIIRESDSALDDVIGTGEHVREIDPVSNKSERHSLIGVWVDGGFFNNIPSHIFDRAATPGETLSLRLGSNPQEQPTAVTNLAEYYMRIPGGLIFGTGESLASRSYDNKYRGIALDTGDLTLVSFQPTPEQAAAVRLSAIQYVFRYFDEEVPGDLLRP